MTSASASCPESDCGKERESAALAAGVAMPARLSLAQLLQRFGRGVCHDPHRCSALIRDLCEGSYREQFLWTVALEEGIVAELRTPAAGLPRELLLAGLGRKLADRLGLSPEAAAWAVRSWMEALHDAPETTAETFAPAISPPAPDDGEQVARAGGRRWLGWCTVALASALLVLLVAAWCTVYFDVSTVGHWIEETAVLAGGCCLGWLGLRFSSARLITVERPAWSHLRPAWATAAILPEIMVVLLLPLTPVGVTAFWAAACWAGWPDASGQAFVAWVLARIFQGLLLAGFVTLWTPEMISTEGRLVAGWREFP